jgi:hypothetical protein
MTSKAGDSAAHKSTGFLISPVMFDIVNLAFLLIWQVKMISHYN